MLKFAISYWIIQLSFLSVYAQNLCMPVGWATENGGTTGGGSASPIVVSTLADLQASSSGSKKFNPIEAKTMLKRKITLMRKE